MIQGRSKTSSAPQRLGLTSPALLLTPAGPVAAAYNTQQPSGVMASVSGASTLNKDAHASKISLSQRIAMTGIPRTSTGVSLIVKNSSRLVPNKRTFSSSQPKLLSATGSYFSSSPSSGICDVSSVNKVLGAKTYGKRNLIKQASETTSSLISGSWVSPICSSSISSSLSDNKFDGSSFTAKNSSPGGRGVTNPSTDADTRDVPLTPRLAVAMIPREKPRSHPNAIVFSSDVGISATSLSQICQSQLIRTGSVSAGGGQLIKTGAVNSSHLMRTSINGGQKPFILATLPATSASKSANPKTSFFHPTSGDDSPCETHSVKIEEAAADARVTVVGVGTDTTDAHSATVDGAIVTTTVCGSGTTAIVDTSTGTATLVEGAEVVRSSVVSYATPIMHQVFLQAGAPAHAFSAHLPHSPEGDESPPPEDLSASDTTPAFRDSTSAKLVVTSPCLLVPSTAQPLNDSNNNNRKLHTPDTEDMKLPLRLADGPVLQRADGHQRPDDELTSLSWLQDANLLKGTALSPVKLSSTKPASSPTPSLSPDPCRDTLSGRHTTDSGSSDALNMNAGLFRALPDRHILTKDGPRRMKAESPTSDYGDESMDANDSLDATSEGYSIGPSKSRSVVSSSQQASGCAKPPYSFSCLIFMAIEDSEEKALPVKSIYAWVQHHFPYFRTAPAGWKNSVRHNLSLNKCFSKVDKSPALGKGSLWMVDPAHRPNLLQSLSKVPSHPHAGNDKVFMLSTRGSGAGRGRNSDPVNRISVGSAASRPMSSSTYSSSPGLSTSGNNRQIFISSSSSQPSEPTYHASSMSSSSKQVSYRNISSSPVSSSETHAPRDVPSTCSSSLMSATNSPDPTLFPFLARRLGGLGTHVTSSESSSRSGIESNVPVDVSIEKLPGVGSLAGVGIEDVDAANAMLTLKHGHKAMAPLQDVLLSLREGVARQQNEESYLRHKRKLSDANLGIGETLSPNDHSYGPSYSTHSTAGMATPSTGVTLYSLPSHSTSPCALASHSSSPCSSSFSSPCSSTPPTPPLAPSSARLKVRNRVGTSAKGADAGSPTSSVDEAFSDGSFESDVGDVGQQSPSDFQQMVDGADALLNFAARATTLMPQLLMGRLPDDNQHPGAAGAVPVSRPRPNMTPSFSNTSPAVDRTYSNKPPLHGACYTESRYGSERLFSPIQDHGTSVKTEQHLGDDDDDLFCSETLEPLPKKAMIESSGERLSSPHDQDESSPRGIFANDSRMSGRMDCATTAPDRPEHRPSLPRDQSLQKQSFTTRPTLLKNYGLKLGSGSKLGKPRMGNEATEKTARPPAALKKVSKPKRSTTSKLSNRPLATTRR